MGTGNDHGFCAIVDVTERKQIAPTKVQLPLAHRQPNAVGKMTATRTIDNARAQNYEFETLPLLIFPEQLFLAQLGVGIVITPLRIEFERGLLVHLSPAPEASHPIYTERAHQNNAHRLQIRNCIKQISRSDYRIEEKIGGRSFLSGGKMENKLHIIHRSSGIISILQVSNATLKPNVRMSFRHRVQFGNIRPPP